MPGILKTPSAERDLVKIGRYIAKDNPAAAEELLDTFQQKFEMLSQVSGAGRARPELAPDLRSFPVGRYLIFYLPVVDGIVIVRVLHGARNLRRLFRRRPET